MAVALDALMDAGNSSDGDSIQVDDGTSFSDVSCITVGASATLLLALPVWDSVSGSGPTGHTITWNGNSMSIPTGASVGPTDMGSGGYGTAQVWRLVSPDSGTNTLACSSWTNTADCYCGAASFTGTDTTTGVDDADTDSSTGVTGLTLTSSTDGATVAVSIKNSGDPTMNFNAIWANSPLNPGGGASYQLGGTSNNHTFTYAGGTTQLQVGVHVLAAGGGGTGPTAEGIPVSALFAIGF